MCVMHAISDVCPCISEVFLLEFLVSLLPGTIVLRAWREAPLQTVDSSAWSEISRNLISMLHSNIHALKCASDGLYGGTGSPVLST